MQGLLSPPTQLCCCCCGRHTASLLPSSLSALFPLLSGKLTFRDCDLPISFFLLPPVLTQSGFKSLWKGHKKARVRKRRQRRPAPHWEGRKVSEGGRGALCPDERGTGRVSIVWVQRGHMPGSLHSVCVCVCVCVCGGGEEWLRGPLQPLKPLRPCCLSLGVEFTDKRAEGSNYDRQHGRVKAGVNLGYGRGLGKLKGAGLDGKGLEEEGVRPICQVPPNHPCPPTGPTCCILEVVK